MIVLCHDPSFSAWGWAVVNHNPETNTGELIAQGCCHAPKKLKKTQILQTDNQRLTLLTSYVWALMQQHKPNLVLREETVGSKGAAALRLLSLAKGLLFGMCQGTQTELRSITATTTKIHLTGKPDGSKREMVEAVQKVFPVLQSWQCKQVEREAVCDALALYITWAAEQQSSQQNTKEK